MHEKKPIMIFSVSTVFPEACSNKLLHAPAIMATLRLQ